MQLKSTLLASVGPMTPMERAAGRYMRAPDHDEGEQAAESYSHATNDFDSADIEVAGAGAEEENKAPEKDVDKGEEDKQPEKVKGADEAGASDEDGEEGDKEGDKQPSAEDEDGAKRKPRYERRIDNLTARNKELEERLAKLEKGGEPEKPDHRGGKPEEAATNDKPKLQDFDTYEDWVDAVTDWKVDQKLSKRESDGKAKDANKAFATRVIEGAKRYTDWDEVVTEDVKIPLASADAIRETDDPAAVIYFLGDNPEEVKRLSSLSPAKQAIEIGKIEAALVKTDKKATGEDTGKLNIIPKAPEPVKAPKGDGDKVTKTVDDMDADEYISYMNKKQGIRLLTL
jgi:hypothetical protein